MYGCLCKVQHVEYLDSLASRAPRDERPQLYSIVLKNAEKSSCEGPPTITPDLEYGEIAISGTLNPFPA